MFIRDTFCWNVLRREHLQIVRLCVVLLTAASSEASSQDNDADDDDDDDGEAAEEVADGNSSVSGQYIDWY